MDIRASEGGRGGGGMKDKIKILEMIAEDMKNDAVNFDGRPFNGKTVAQYFGNQGAAIAALANIIKSILEEKNETN
jgi:hypothetical protein